MEHQTTTPERILKLCYYKLYQGTAWINCKTNVSTERWNSRAEFNGKNDQPRKNLDKLTIYFYLSRTLWGINLVSLLLLRKHKQIFFIIPSLLNCVYCVSTCQRGSRAHVPTCFACLRANVACVLTCSHGNVSCVLTCSRANVPCVVSC